MSRSSDSANQTRKKRWSVTIEAEDSGDQQRRRIWWRWLMLFLALAGIVATAVGNGWLP